MSERAAGSAPNERLLAGAAALAGLTLGAFSAHRGLFNDGIFFVQWLSDWPLREGEQHVLVYPHLLYLPLAKLFHGAVSLVSPMRIDDSLRLFSAIGLALAGPMLVRLFGAFVGIRANAAATALVLLTPTVWFCAGATELHELHLAASAFALAMAARPPRRGPGLAFAAGVAAVCGTHLTGFLLVPAMILLRLRSLRGSDPAPVRRSLGLAAVAAISLASLAAAALAAHALWPERSVLTLYFRTLHPAEQGYWETVGVELFARTGVLVPLAIFSAAALALARAERLLAAAIFAVFPVYLHVIGTSRVGNEGGYAIATVPLFAAACAAGLERLPARVGGALALATLAAQGWIGAALVAPVVARDDVRDAAEAIGKVVKPGDALVLFVRRGAIDCDLAELPNLTRLYFGREVPNAALLDEANAAGSPYLAPEAADALRRRIADEAAAALGSGRRAWVRAEVLAADPARPRLGVLAADLRARHRIGGTEKALSLVELETR